MIGSCSMCRKEVPVDRLDARPLPVPAVDAQRVASLYRLMRSLLKAPDTKIYFDRNSPKGRHLRDLAEARYVSNPRRIVGNHYVTEMVSIPLACRECSDTELARLIQAGIEWAAERDAATKAKAETRRRLEEKRASEPKLKEVVTTQSNEGGRSPLPARLRFLVLRRDGFRCVYCGRAATGGLVLHVDHVIPKSTGGLDAEENLVTSCSDCNLGKAATFLEPLERDTENA